MTEILGRLYLWQIAIDRIIELLSFRERIDRFCNTGRPRDITELYDNERIRLKTCLRLEGEELDDFENKHGFLFPDIHDIQLIEELITEEIIIKFCTIFNEGYGKTGVISANKKSFWKPVLDEIILMTFSNDVKDKFYQFIENAKTYRDKQGAHFDHESFSVTHGNKKPNEDGLICSVGWSNALQAFNWDFVCETIPQLSKSLGSYIEKLQNVAEKDN